MTEENIVHLPTRILYGQKFQILIENIKAEPLKYNNPYRVSIGIAGVSKNLEVKFIFSASANFMLTKNENGEIEIIQHVGNGEQGLKKIIRERNLY